MMVEQSFTTNSAIQGYHIYKDGWDAPVDAKFSTVNKELGTI